MDFVAAYDQQTNCRTKDTQSLWFFNVPKWFFNVAKQFFLLTTVYKLSRPQAILLVEIYRSRDRKVLLTPGHQCSPISLKKIIV
jgi:hypothetical protein